MNASIACMRTRVRRLSAFLIPAVLLIVLAAPTTALAPPVVHQTWWVAETGSDSNDGTSTAEPFRTITHALSVAAAGDTVMIGPSTYSASTGETLPLASSGVSLKSTDGSATTIIDGGGTAQGLTLSTPWESLELRGLTFRNCSNGPGDAIMAYGSSVETGWPWIAECGFVDNHDPLWNGAGLYLMSPTEGSQPRIEGNYFSNNRADAGAGGALFISGDVDASITGNTFVDNAGYNGGAVFFSYAVAANNTIRDNTFASNESTWGGGAICCFAAAPATLTIDGNRFYGNESQLGGALRLDIDAPGGAIVTNNDAGGNEASDGGGFAWVERGVIVSKNNAIGGNGAGNRGGAWYLNGGAVFSAVNDTVVDSQEGSAAIEGDNGASVQVSNCIVYNPALGSDVGGASSITYSCLHDTAAASKGNTLGAGVLFVDPQIASPASHTIDLADTSPCIDTATDTVAPPVDFYGTARPLDGNGDGVSRADMGAFEHKIPTLMQLAAPAISDYSKALVNGVLEAGDETAIAGAVVVLEYSYDNFATTAGSVTETTNASGEFSHTFAPKRLTYYRASWEGDATHAASNKETRAVLPKVYLTRPSVKTTMTYGKSYTASGYLKPQHPAGSKPVRILLYKKKGGQYVLSSKHYHAKVKHYKSYSKYYVSVKLPSRGRWRLKAHHPADSLNASTKSSYRYVTVK